MTCSQGGRGRCCDLVPGGGGVVHLVWGREGGVVTWSGGREVL